MTEFTWTSFSEKGTLYAGVVATALSTLHAHHVETRFTTLTTVLTEHLSKQWKLSFTIRQINVKVFMKQ